jgi:hypothetical protein
MTTTAAESLPPGMLSDAEFDRLLAPGLRARSEVHFTPAAVARRAAQLLVAVPGTRVLDVGSAVGKFCVIAAVTSPDAWFVGVERRSHLVAVAGAIVRQLAIANVSVVHGDALEVDWSGFDAFYLFNPFGEHLGDGTPPLDDRIELHPEYYAFYVRAVRERLAAAAAGSRVVTYHGFGCRPPPGYALTAREAIGTDCLELWIKTATSPRRRHGPLDVVQRGGRSP